jgi:hypothetical protein
MKLLYTLADAFIMTFGITPPRPENRRTAALFIGAGIFLTLLAVLGLFAAVIARLLAR